MFTSWPLTSLPFPSHLGAHTYTHTIDTHQLLFAHTTQFHPVHTDLCSSGIPHGFVFPAYTCTCVVSLGAGHRLSLWALSPTLIVCFSDGDGFWGRSSERGLLKLREKDHINSHKLLHFGAQIARETPGKSPFFTIWHVTCHLPTGWQLIRNKKQNLG